MSNFVILSFLACLVLAVLLCGIKFESINKEKATETAYFNRYNKVLYNISTLTEDLKKSIFI